VRVLDYDLLAISHTAPTLTVQRTLSAVTGSALRVATGRAKCTSLPCTLALAQDDRPQNEAVMDRKSPLHMHRLAPFAEHAYALLRVVAGAMFMFHGVQKVLGVLGEMQPVGSQLWIGGVLELVCGAAIALGLFTRLAAFLASGVMAVAYIQFHWKFQFGAAFFPAVNQGELAVLYCFVFLYIACKGGGRCSLDNRRPRVS